MGLNRKSNHCLTGDWAKCERKNLYGEMAELVYRDGLENRRL